MSSPNDMLLVTHSGFSFRSCTFFVGPFTPDRVFLRKIGWPPHELEKERIVLDKGVPVVVDVGNGEITLCATDIDCVESRVRFLLSAKRPRGLSFWLRNTAYRFTIEMGHTRETLPSLGREESIREELWKSPERIREMDEARECLFETLGRMESIREKSSKLLKHIPEKDEARGRLLEMLRRMESAREEILEALTSARERLLPQCCLFGVGAKRGESVREDAWLMSEEDEGREHPSDILGRGKSARKHPVETLECEEEEGGLRQALVQSEPTAHVAVDFGPGFTEDEIKACLSYLSELYRSCGGIGLKVIRHYSMVPNAVEVP